MIPSAESPGNRDYQQKQLNPHTEAAVQNVTGIGVTEYVAATFNVYGLAKH